MGKYLPVKFLTHHGSIALKGLCLRASIYAGLVDVEQAFGYSEKASQEKAIWLLYLKADPRFDTLRADERFAALLRRIGFN